MHLIDIADTAVMLPLAGAIAGWLAAGRAWKLAAYWCLLFGMGLSIVAMSKILFIGWAAGIPALGFKALSGHTLRATVVLPVLSFVLLQRAPIRWRTAGLVAGVAFSIVIGVLLVRLRFHTPSEVIATAILGGLISFAFLRIAATLPPPHLNGWMAPLSLIAFVLIFSLKPSSLNHRLVDVALYLSDRDHPYTWSEKIGKHCLSRNP
jgi:membrane-associated phospholipid phosphatase